MGGGLRRDLIIFLASPDGRESYRNVWYAQRGDVYLCVAHGIQPIRKTKKEMTFIPELIALFTVYEINLCRV